HTKAFFTNWPSFCDLRSTMTIQPTSPNRSWTMRLPVTKPLKLHAVMPTTTWRGHRWSSGVPTGPPDRTRKSPRCCDPRHIDSCEVGGRPSRVESYVVVSPNCCTGAPTATIRLLLFPTLSQALRSELS